MAGKLSATQERELLKLEQAPVTINTGAGRTYNSLIRRGYAARHGNNFEITYAGSEYLIERGISHLEQEDEPQPDPTPTAEETAVDPTGYMRPCEHCGGEGVDFSTQYYRACPACSGTGIHTPDDDTAPDATTDSETVDLADPAFTRDLITAHEAMTAKAEVKPAAEHSEPMTYEQFIDAQRAILAQIVGNPNWHERARLQLELEALGRRYDTESLNHFMAVTAIEEPPVTVEDTEPMPVAPTDDEIFTAVHVADQRKQAEILETLQAWKITAIRFDDMWLYVRIGDKWHWTSTVEGEAFIDLFKSWLNRAPQYFESRTFEMVNGGVTYTAATNPMHVVVLPAAVSDQVKAA